MNGITDTSIPLARRAMLAGLVFEHHIVGELLVCRLTDAAGKRTDFDSSEQAEAFLAGLAAAHGVGTDRWVRGALCGWDEVQAETAAPVPVAPAWGLLHGRITL